MKLKNDLKLFGITLSVSNDFGFKFFRIESLLFIESLILVIPVNLISSFDLDKSKLFQDDLTKG